MNRHEDVAAQGRARNEKGESLDDFMRRTENVAVPNSLKRMAWALNKPIPEVVDAYEKAMGRG